MKKGSKILNYARAVLVPVLVFLICEVLSMTLAHVHLFSSAFDQYSFLTGIPLSVIAAYALSVNMTAGRMDLSLGGQQLVACIIGGNIALRMGWGVSGVVAMTLLFGALAGIISGGLFVLLRIDAFILGLGLALVYEGITIHYNVEGLVILNKSITSVLSNQYVVFAVGMGVCCLMYILMNKTVFGYRYKVIQGSQTAAVNSGINVKLHCIICYILCGVLIALAGIIKTGINGSLPTTLNLGTVTTVFSGFLPVLLAFYLVEFVPLEIGILIGAATCKLIEILMGKLNLNANYSIIILMSSMFIIIILLNLVKERQLAAAYKERGLID